MKKVFVIFFICALVAIIGFTTIYIIPIRNDIEKEVAVIIYVDEIKTEKTKIIINGEITKRLLTGEWDYNGVFCIGYYEPTCRDNVTANITGDSSRIKRIGYYSNGDFTTFEFTGLIIINREMDEIALGLLDGTIMATSEEMYYEYKSEQPD